ncbi:MAG: elongation factor P maturation arginine rhamnosyltransferase EarP, partial [Burkholderiaceae bacterium]
GWHGEQVVSLFCYEPDALAELLALWQTQERPTRLLVTQGRAEAAVRAWLASTDTSRAQVGTLAIDFLPNLSQTDFDHLLWACDLNLVRGEDSVVRALWAGKPFLWQIYPQHDNAHHAKLTAFLDRLDAPASLSAAHAAWNGVCQGPMPVLMLDSWRAWAADVRRDLWQQSDLTSRLTDFVARAQAHGRPRSESR